MELLTCAITQKSITTNQAVEIDSLNNNLKDIIYIKYNLNNTQKYIGITALNSLKIELLQGMIEDDKQRINNFKAISFADRLSDKIASFGGSWTFIILFLTIILVWIITNVFLFMNKGFDPYPFILLNLVLSCIAAIQAPVIMMSQNRQEEKDRARSIQDFTINLKAELELQQLNIKIDEVLQFHQSK